TMRKIRHCVSGTDQQFGLFKESYPSNAEGIAGDETMGWKYEWRAVPRRRRCEGGPRSEHRTCKLPDRRDHSRRSRPALQLAGRGARGRLRRLSVLYRQVNPVAVPRMNSASLSIRFPFPTGNWRWN